MTVSSTNYVTKYSPLVDEAFKLTSKTDSLVNKDYEFIGAKTVKVYTVQSVAMGDYTRSGDNRYGTPAELTTDVQEMTMTQDKAFTFTVDKMNEDETGGAVNPTVALARQIRERVIPMVDIYRLGVIAASAPASNVVTVAKASPLTKDTVYDAITTGTEKLDDLEVPEEGRELVVTPSIYKLMKNSKDIEMDTEIGMEMKKTGVVAMIDGMVVKKVPANRLPANTNFIITHPVATTAPVKLAEYKIHNNVPGISGTLVEGRVYHDAFVLGNKKNAIYVSKNATA